jgi:hypothetical protein
MGLLSRLYSWASDRDSGVNIDADRMDAEFDSYQTAINNRIDKDGSLAMTGNLNLGSQKIVSMAAGSSGTDAVNMNQLRDNASGYAVDSGAADAYVVTLSPAPSGYTAGMLVAVKIGSGNTNTGASTINVNGLGVKSIKKHSDVDPDAGDIEQNGIYELRYDGTNFQIMSMVASDPDGIFASLTANQTISGNNTLSGTNTHSGANTFSGQVTFSKGADLTTSAVTAGVLTVGSDGNYFDFTGTDTISAITTVGVGTTIKIHCDAAATFKHSAANLVLPGGANITAAAGDEFEFFEYASADWRCVRHSRSDGRPTKTTGNIGQALSSDIAKVTAASTDMMTATAYTSDQAPTITGGTELASVSITPTSTSSKILIAATFCWGTTSNNDNVIAALFRGNTCIAVQSSLYPGTVGVDRKFTMSFNRLDSPSTTASTTYSLRFGKTQAGVTWQVNYDGSSIDDYGGTFTGNQLTVLEVLP